MLHDAFGPAHLESYGLMSEHAREMLEQKT